MINLWEETIEVLENHNKTWKDVQIIYGEDFQITKDNFEKVAKETDYDNGYGGQEVAKDLVILGNGFVMSRDEYDGAECWQYLHTGFDIPKEVVEVKKLGEGSWNTLKEIQEAEYYG